MTVHVIGAGLAGLAAALRLAGAGRHVVLHEQTRAAGGRCLAFAAPAFGRTLDNGIHLYFARQRHLHGFLADIGQPHALVGPARAACGFVDVQSGRRWMLHPSVGLLPVWLLTPWRAVPGTRPTDFLRLFAMAWAGPAATVAQIMPRRGPSRRSFWEPLCVAALNTEPEAASAQALWRMVRGVLTASEGGLRPQFVARNLTADLIDPAIRAVQARGGELRLGSRLRAIEGSDRRAVLLRFGEAAVALGAGDDVVLAVPATEAGRLLPELAVPRQTRAVVTAHFALKAPAAPEPVLTALIDQRSLWLLTRGDLATVTVGAADDLLGLPNVELARRLWATVARALRRPGDLPSWQVLKFRRATYAHTPAEEARRPPARTSRANLVLAGDWTRTGPSATVDGAIQSGYAAAEALLGGQTPPA